MYFSTLSLGRKALMALMLLTVAVIAAKLGYGLHVAGGGLIVGMAWAGSEPLLQLLTSLGLADTTYGVLAPKCAVLAKTADYTVTGDEPSGTTFTTRGAAGAINFTLPVAAMRHQGKRYRFKNVVDQNMTVTSSPADTLVTFNDLTADSLAASTAGAKIGAEMEVFCDGTSWFAAGIAVGHTYTVAT